MRSQFVRSALVLGPLLFIGLSDMIAVAEAGQRSVAANATVALGEAWEPALGDAAGLRQPGLVVRVRTDLVRRAAAEGGTLSLPLPGGASVRAAIAWVQSGPNESFVAGPLADAGGEASLTLVGDTLAGRIVSSDRLYMIRRVGDGVTHIVTEVDPQSFPPESQPPRPPLSASRDLRRAEIAADTNAFVDLLVLYTPAARAAIGSTSAMIAELTGAVNNANLALANARVTHRYRLAHQQEIAYTESGDISTSLSHLTSADGVIDSVFALRDQVRADDVTLLTTDGNACGFGWLMGPSNVNASFASFAFNVVNWNCANANLSMAHEIGHNMGLQHDRPNASVSSPPAFSYAFGYAVSNVGRDIMAYDFNCTSCPRKAIYSTPLANFPGTVVRAGTATEDNARALNNTSLTVANFRQSVCNYTLGSTFANVGPAGGTGSVSVIAAAGCAWSAATNDPAVVTITSGATGSGTGVVSYTVAPNSGAQRTATLAIAGIVFTVTQAAPHRRGDFDGDARTDIAVYRPSNGTWYLLTSATNFTSGVGYQWGVNIDLPVPGDYDGDGKSDISLFRPSTGHWFILRSSSSFTTWATYQWGVSGDTPVPADYDGDGRTDVAVYRPSAGSWFILTSSSGFVSGLAYTWGASTDVPVPGDYDGDGRSDLGVYRPSSGHWFVRTSATSYAASVIYQWGVSGDVPVAGDYDGDRRRDLAVYRPSNGTWYILTSGSSFTAGWGYSWGASTDLPVSGDYDGDGASDIVVYRPSSGHWFILRSTMAFTASSVYQWGTPGDIPLLRAP